MEGINVTIVGDSYVGKTNLITSFVNDVFEEEHIKTITDQYRANIMIDNSTVNLNIYDTNGNYYETKEILEKNGDIFKKTDIFILCFEKGNRMSEISAKYCWYNFVTNISGKENVIYVQTKDDLDVETPKRRQKNYIACSAKHKKNIKKVFEEAVLRFREFSKPPPEKKKLKNTIKKRLKKLNKFLSKKIEISIK